MLEETEALGPGKRFAIWLQGCNRRCIGCLSPRSQPLTGGNKYKISEIVHKISEVKGIEGLTISGGEPFLQAEGLNQLIIQLKQIKDYGIIVYTGYKLEQLKAKEKSDISVKELLSNIDLLIDGEYVKELNDGRRLRGSANQQVFALTDRYKNHLASYGTSGRKVEIFFKEDKIYFSGIPGKKFLHEWNNKLT
jgi:anaerobic ribonucleoside-triphosphate reductase activating protein